MLSGKLMSAASTNAGLVYVGGYVQGFAGTTSNVVISLTGLTGGIGSQPAANDLVIAYFATGSTADRNLVVSGYTEIAELYSNDSSDTNLVAAYKFMTPTADTTVTLTGGTLSNSDNGAIAIQVWRNVDSVTPLDVTSTTATGVDTLLCNPPSITPTTGGAVIVSGGAGAYTSGTAVTYASSDLSNFRTVGFAAGTAQDVVVGLGSKNWVSGAFDPAAFTLATGSDSTSYSWAAVTLALRPKNPS